MESPIIRSLRVIKETVRDTDTVITGKSERTPLRSNRGQTSDVTLKDVSIKSDKDAALKVEGDGNVRLELDGKNELKSGANHAGVEKNNSDSKGTLTIKDDTGEKGSLTATGGAQGAGIGGAKTTAAVTLRLLAVLSQRPADATTTKQETAVRLALVAVLTAAELTSKSPAAMSRPTAAGSRTAPVDVRVQASAEVMAKAAPISLSAVKIL